MSKQLVADIKAQLVASGADLSGACGAFKITKRVAWALRSQGYGLLAKGGNNCEGFSTDCVILPDGTHYDVLGDGGGANSPQWVLVKNPDGTPFKKPEAYRPALDPGDVPPPPPPPPPPPVDLSAVLAKLAVMDAKLDAILAKVNEDIALDTATNEKLAELERFVREWRVPELEVELPPPFGKVIIKPRQ